MRQPVRLIGCGALAAGALAFGLAIPSGVAFAKPVSGSCTTLTGGETTQSLSGCNDTADTGGSGTSVVTLSGTSGTTTITWASGKTTVESFKAKELIGKKDKCTTPPGDTALAEAKETGKVTGGTATDLVKGKTKGTVCAFDDASGNIVVQNVGPVTF